MSNCKGRPEKRGGGVTCVQCGKLCISPRALKIHHTKTHKKRTENGMFKGSASQTATPMRKVNWATTDPRRQMEIRANEQKSFRPTMEKTKNPLRPPSVASQHLVRTKSDFA
uniref:C2H2-type domain-containing protein n=1 Tax=Globodera pallida TaxID=36090 RepID=A0A183CHG7_GLOPA